MKKLKIFMMMAALSVVLCACGGKETEQSGDAENGNNTAVEQTLGDDKQDKPATEDKKSKDSKKYECLPELLEASPEDRVFQIGDVVLRFDGTMSLKEAVETLENSSIEYEFKINYELSDVGMELNMDRLIQGREDFTVYVMKNGEEFLSLGIENTSTELRAASDNSSRFT